MDAMARHQCLIYEGSPAKYLRTVAQLLFDRLRANYRCLYLNSPAMVAGIRSYLAAMGLDVAQEASRGALVLLSDQKHLVDGRFHAAHMLSLLAEAVEGALTDGYAGLWATGDMTWEFGSWGNFEDLLEYECGLEELFRRQPALTGLCQYHHDTLPEDALQVAISQHDAMYLNETLLRMNPFYVRAGSAKTHGTSTPNVSEMLEELRLRAE
jgi:MEDS: MEthanogen/methylotroph, DcmR Sensory domain